MNSHDARRKTLEDLAAEGDETAAHDYFVEFGAVVGTEPDSPPDPPAHAPHRRFSRMGLTCPNEGSRPCVAGRQ